MNKVKEALDRIERVVGPFCDEVFVGHSGGKDSCVINHLATQVLGQVPLVHNVKPMLGTSGDPVAALTEMHPETLEFLYSEVCKNHRVTFMHSVFMPSWITMNRMTLQIDGARQAEASRPGKSSDFIRDGVNVNRSLMSYYEPKGIFGLGICYPIFDWSDDDVFDYLYHYKIPFSKEYLKNGEYDSWKWRQINW